jgi:hypothetical protein
MRKGTQGGDIGKKKGDYFQKIILKTRIENYKIGRLEIGGGLMGIGINWLLG